MDEESRGNRDPRGTWLDWPALLLAVTVALVVIVFASGGTPTPLVWLLVLFAGVAWLIRAGAFSPRRH